MIKRPISEHDQWIVDEDNTVTGIAPAGTGKETTLVGATTDPLTGRITGLTGSGGVSSPFGVTKNSVMLFGDSNTERSWLQTSFTGIVDNGDGTATATTSGTPYSTANQLNIGDRIRVNNHPTPKINQLSAVISAVTASSITFPITGAYSDMVGTGNGQWIEFRRRWVIGWYNYFQKLVNAEMPIVAYCAQGGCRIAHVLQMLQRGYANTVTARFGIIGPMGINDIYNAGLSLAQVKADMTALLQEIVGRVQYLAVFTCPPILHTNGNWTSGKLAIHHQYNRWFAAKVKSLGGILIDSNLATSNSVTYCNGADTTYADATTAMIDASDRTHPTGIGAFALGKAAATALSSLIIPDMVWPSNAMDCVYADTSSKFMLDSSQVLLTGTGGTKAAGSGTITGNVPDGCRVEWLTGGTALTATLSSVARTVSSDGDAIGNNLEIAISGTAGALSRLRFSVTATAGRFAAGDVIRALARVKAPSPAGITAINTAARLAQSVATIVDSSTCNDVDAKYTEMGTLYEVTPWQTINSNNGSITSVTMFIDIWIEDGATTGSTVTIAHPNLQKQEVVL